MTLTNADRRRRFRPDRHDGEGRPNGLLPHPPAGSPVRARSTEGRRRATLFCVTLGSDAATIALSMLLGYLLATLVRPAGQLVRPPGLFLLLPAYLAGFVVLRGLSHDRQRLVPSAVADLARTAQLLVLGAVIAMAEAGIIGRINGRYLHIAEAVLLATPGVLLVPLGRSVALRLVTRRRQWAPRVVIVGSGRLADSIVGRFAGSDDANLVGVVDGDGKRPGLIGGLADLPQLCERHRVDRVLITPSMSSPKSTLEVVQRLSPAIAVSLVPEFYELLNFRSTVEELAGLPLVHVKPATLSSAAKAAKRLFDVVGSALLMVVLLPVWVVLAIAIKRDSPGPVFFRQERPGLHRKPFPIIKLRTMTVDAEARRQEVAPLNEHADTPLFKARDDPRVTSLGRYLRQRHLDELPQLVNVLLGQMSLVGPRPFPTEECDSLAPRRFEVRPGMTGLWQVSGRIDLSHDDLLYLDTIYVASWSFWWDLRILLQTPKVLIDRAGDGSGRRSGPVRSEGIEYQQPGRVSATGPPVEAGD